MNQILKSKKAMMSIKVIIGIFLAVIIILATFSFIIKFYSAFLESKDSSFQNFDSLCIQVKELISDKKNLATIQAFPFYLSKDWIVIGIDSNWNDEKKVDSHHDQVIPRPSQCTAGAACLCMWKEEGGGDYDKPPEKCYSFPKNDPIYFSGADGYEDFYGHENKENNIKEYCAHRIAARNNYYTKNNIDIPQGYYYTFTSIPEDFDCPFDYPGKGKHGVNDGYSKNFI